MDVAETVDAPEATPGSDTPPGADVSSAASNGQRGRGGGRGGGRGSGGRGGRGPRPEPTVKPEEIVVDAEFTGTVVRAFMSLHSCLQLPVDLARSGYTLIRVARTTQSAYDHCAARVWASWHSAEFLCCC